MNASLQFRLDKEVLGVAQLSNIYGETTGIRKSLLNSIENLYNFSVPASQILTVELMEALVEITAAMKRELAIYVNRRGQVTAVAVGDLRTVSLPETEARRSTSRLSGVRCIHTHPDGTGLLSDIDISALKLRRFDIMVAIGVKDKSESDISFGYITDIDVESFAFDILGPMSGEQLLNLNFTSFINRVERQLSNVNYLESTRNSERTILAGIELPNAWNINDSLQELAQLAETAGAEVLGSVYQKRDKPDNSLFFGRGKVEEISLMVQMKNANVLIIDDEISPAQQRNLEQTLGIKVIDRTALILDVFAQRARTHEGKLQVELAQLQYHLPRLGGMGLVLSRLGGGIGTRGPGETKLEVDRRKIRSRISDIKNEIENIKRQRELHRKARQASNIPTVALVGYTNAGKSTLLNALTNAGVLAEDKLFATLDPTTRRVALPDGLDVLITDTVGFIQKLPHQLVVAFRATLEEVVQADLLIHVIDVSHSQHTEQSDAVFQVLRELKVEHKPMITVLNKIDKLGNESINGRLLRTENSIAVSACSGDGVDLLVKMVEKMIRPAAVDREFLIPYNDTGIISQLYDIATVHSVDYRENGIYVKASMPMEKSSYFETFVIGDV